MSLLTSHQQVSIPDVRSDRNLQRKYASCRTIDVSGENEEDGREMVLGLSAGSRGARIATTSVLGMPKV